MKIDMSGYTMVDPDRDGFYSIKTFAQNNISVRPSTLKDNAFAGWVKVYVKDPSLKKGRSNEWVKLRVLELFVEAATMETRSHSTQSHPNDGVTKGWLSEQFQGIKGWVMDSIRPLTDRIRGCEEADVTLKGRVDRLESAMADSEMTITSELTEAWKSIRELREELGRLRGDRGA